MVFERTAVARVALQSVAIGAQPDPAAAVLENGSDVVGRALVACAVVVEDEAECRSKRVRLAQAKRLAADPEQAGLVDHQGRHLGGRQAATQETVAADPVRLARLRVEVDQTATAHRHPDLADAILGDRDDGIVAFVRPDQTGPAAGRIDPVQAQPAADQDRMVLALVNAVQFIEHIGVDAFDLIGIGRNPPQAMVARHPDRVVAGNDDAAHGADGVGFVLLQDALALAGIRVQPLQPAAPAQPEPAEVVEGERTERLALVARGCLGWQGERLEARGLRIEAGDSAGAGRDPEAALVVLGERRDDAVGQAVRVVGIVFVDLEPIAVELVQAGLGADPHGAVTGLRERLDGVLQQTSFVVETIEEIVAFDGGSRKRAQYHQANQQARRQQTDELSEAAGCLHSTHRWTRAPCCCERVHAQSPV